MRTAPYPILQEDTDDYKTGSLEAKFDCNHEGAKLLFNVDIHLDESVLSELVTSGKASFVILIQSGTTFLRTIKRTDKPQLSFSVDKREAGSELVLTPYLIANEDIEDYSNSNLHEDYGNTIFIPKNGILAAGISRVITIQRGDLKIAQTICEFESCKTEEIEYDEFGDKIVIRLPKELYSVYHYSHNNVKLAYTAMIAIPILIDLTEKYFIGEEVPPEQDSAWYLCLGDKFKSCPGELKDSGYKVVKWMLGEMQMRAALDLRECEEGKR